MTHLEMAEALDSMERNVSSWEADFLESVLKRLKDDGRTLSEKQATKLKELYERYLGDETDDDEPPSSESGGDQVDEDDFI